MREIGLTERRPVILTQSRQHLAYVETVEGNGIEKSGTEMTELIGIEETGIEMIGIEMIGIEYTGMTGM